MIQLRETIEVGRPIAEVFRWVADFANTAQWDPSVSVADKVTPGPVGEGTSYRLVVGFGTSRIPMDYRITRYDFPTVVRLEGRGENVTAFDDIRFEDLGGRTRIDYVADLDLRGVPGWSMPLLGPLMRRYGRRSIHGMQRALAVRPAPGHSLLQQVADRTVLPGVFGFTKQGYRAHRRCWTALTASMDGRTVIVTGATSGLGLAAATRLASMGARIVLVGRNAERLDSVRQEIQAETGNTDLSVEVADLSMMSDIHALAGRLLKNEARIDVLINNAGVLLPTREVTTEGIETTLATNLLGHYLLTHLLLARLRESRPARIVNVASGGMYTQRIRVDDLQFTEQEWDGSVAYARTKRGQVIITEMLADKLRDSGVTVNAMHPGWADTPGVEKSLPAFHEKTRNVLRTPEEGADTMVWLAAAPEVEDVSGLFWLDRTPRATHVFPGTRETPGERAALWEALKEMAELDHIDD